jgi:hypothetical protein
MKGMVRMRHFRFFCLLFLVGSLGALGMPVLAQDLACADFSSPAAAQVVLDSQPDFAGSLDPDGNGVACDHDEGNGTPASDERTPIVVDAEAAAYLASIQVEVDSLQGNVNRFLEIDSRGTGTTPDEVDELNQIAAGWVDYPDVAAGFVAPEGFEFIQQEYLGVAGSFSAAGGLWQAFWAIPSGDPGEVAALQAFNAEFVSARNELQGLRAIVVAVSGSSGDPEGSPDAVAVYLETVRDTASAWNGSIDRISELYVNSIATGAGNVPDAEAAETAEIIATWTDAPNIAAALTVPAGYEGIQESYEGFAGSLANAAASFTARMEGEGSGTALAFSIAQAQARYDNLDGLLTEAGS